MNNINEIFGHPIDSKQSDALSDFENYKCRFINKKCDKESRLIEYPMGVCS